MSMMSVDDILRLDDKHDLQQHEEGLSLQTLLPVQILRVNKQLSAEATATLDVMIRRTHWRIAKDGGWLCSADGKGLTNLKIVPPRVVRMVLDICFDEGMAMWFHLKSIARHLFPQVDEPRSESIKRNITINHAAPSGMMKAHEQSPDYFRRLGPPTHTPVTWFVDQLEKGQLETLAFAFPIASIELKNLQQNACFSRLLRYFNTVIINDDDAEAHRLELYPGAKSMVTFSKKMPAAYDDVRRRLCNREVVKQTA